MSKLFSSFLLVNFLFWASAPASAHTYFFGLTDIMVNSKTHQLEVIHQFTAHDIENAIAEKKQIRFSLEHANYEKVIQEYIEKRFQLMKDEQVLSLEWAGLEVDKGKITIYQSVHFKNFLSGLLVKNEILVDTYPKQINTVNYQDAAIGGSLTFSKAQRIIRINDNK